MKGRTVYAIDWEDNEEDLRCENAAEQETMPEGQRPDEDLLAYIKRINPELFASMKYLAGSASSVLKSEQIEEISEDPENIRPPPHMSALIKARKQYNCILKIE